MKILGSSVQFMGLNNWIWKRAGAKSALSISGHSLPLNSHSLSFASSFPIWFRSFLISNKKLFPLEVELYLSLRVVVMSRDNSSVRSFSRSNRQLEENENESSNLGNHTPHPPSRTPLNSISDPSQIHGPIHDFPQLALENQQLVSSKGNGTTPRVAARTGKPLSEPSSAQTTPAKGVPRVSNVGGRAGSLSRASRGISIARNEPITEVPHFELLENPSFWKDHNVQVC